MPGHTASAIGRMIQRWRETSGRAQVERIATIIARMPE
jgi:hypothetical protein